MTPSLLFCNKDDFPVPALIFEMEVWVSSKGASLFNIILGNIQLSVGQANKQNTWRNTQNTKNTHQEREYQSKKLLLANLLKY